MRESLKKFCEDNNLTITTGAINEGDFYVAERNTGPKLLECKYVDHENKFIVPVEDAYHFDVWECYRVEI